MGIALGLFGTCPSREDMKKLVSLRMRATKPDVQEEKAREKATTYVNRMYRGGIGNIERGTKQAIFTKDLVYSLGYQKMVEFINKKLKDGIEASNLWDYLYTGKFDPTNERHVEYMAEKGVSL
jgi:hypothetical protein